MDAKWADTPRKIEFGAGMKELVLGIGRNHTLSLIVDEAVIDKVPQALREFVNDPMSRVHTECDDLSTRLGKLDAFVQTPAFHALGPVQRGLLGAQRVAMDAYRTCLRERMRRWGE